MSHEGPVVEVVNGLSVISCAECQFAHLSPIPTDEELKALYAERYYAEVKPDYFKHAKADSGWWRLVYNERLALIERWLADEKRRTILDIGSGPGDFLVEARRRGWEGIGYEPSVLAYEHATKQYGLTVYNCEFDDEAASAFSGFDVVNLGEVLEHLPDPAAMLRRVFDALKNGGLVSIVVPNDFSVMQSALQKKGLPPWWVVPEHINYFTVQALYGLVRRCGFAVGDVTTTFPMELFVMMGMNYVGNAEIGREVHAIRKRLEIALEETGLGEMKRQLYQQMARRGIGRDIVMLAKKLGPHQTPPPFGRIDADTDSTETD